MINKIYRVNFMKDKFSYVGLLRNEKKFNINDKIFFSINDHDISFGRVIGVELTLEQNPEYKYKIELPEELVRQRMEYNGFSEAIDIDKVELNCDHIFSTVDEAKESALKNLDRMAELQKKEIDRYFKQFE